MNIGIIISIGLAFVVFLIAYFLIKRKFESDEIEDDDSVEYYSPEPSKE